MEINMTEYEQAYHFLYEYKEEKDKFNRQLTENEWKFVRLLSFDLLKLNLYESADGINLSRILAQISEADTKWNHLLQKALNDFYLKIEYGSKQEAANILKSFLNICPSVWYRSHAEAALEELN
jgi:hypothetical protein